MPFSDLRTLTRRRFLRLTGGGLAALAATGAHAPASPLRFGVIADVHHGLQDDANVRLDAFLQAASAHELDFIIQLGDFCHPTEEARAFIRRWQAYDGPRYHALGNHDMDLGTKADVMAFWGMPQPYYSFDAAGYHLVVLDCNHLHLGGEYVDYADANFYVDGGRRGFVDPEQLAWLRADLDATDRPTLIFTHQALDDVRPTGRTANREAVREILRAANEAAGGRKVLACLCGHQHLDAHSVIDGIHYLELNSASYYWVGEGYGRMAPYRDPLFAFVEVGSGHLALEGRRSAFARPTPAERGYPEADLLSAAIADRRLAFG